MRNGEAEQFGGDPRQALETDMMAMVQVGQQNADAGAKRRAGRHPGRRLGAIALATAPTATAEQLDAGHGRPDWWRVEMIIAVTATLGLGGNVASAMAAGCRHHAFGPVRGLGQRAVTAFTRRPPATLGLAAPAAAFAEIVL